ncbi:MFS transporter [Tessaracoccus palaemonis]|uniref:MFS transporter n=1 Tax=Tessaracoccus palaemonis TaxID=2829499 RepID=A0ABX8SNX2_9ACTN|nr:MFS transporter [Tessaracoccus palaemonis]QXT62909.1 MFS transporter [Tessaracoccus palaemonis]
MQRSIDVGDSPVWTGTTSNEQQPKFPWRVAIGLAMGAFCWIVAYLGAVGVMLPARIAEIDNENKAAIVALNSTISMVVATLANIVIGASSDLSRTRFGRRTPWIWVGAVGSLISLVILGQVQTVTQLILMWAVYQVFLNSIIAPLLATLADRIAPQHRGSAASAYALGMGVGTGLGQVIGAQFLGNTSLGFAVLAGLTVLAGPVASIMFREASSLPMPAKKFDKTMVLENFVFATRNARDYYLALAGKFFMMVAKFTVQGYLLFILTDYMLLEQDQTAGYLSLTATIIMVAGIGMAFVAGPIADRMGRLKLPVILSALLIGIGVFLPFISADPMMIILYAVFAGIGFGAFNAVDQALNIAVLPNPETAAKDLGILNLSNTGGQIAGPLLAAAVITAAGYQMLFVAAAGSALVAIVCFASIRRVK